jgi:4'-phosphopantetheinyl transferase
MIFYICNMETNKLLLDDFKKDNENVELSDILVKLVLKDFNKVKSIGLTRAEMDSIGIKRDQYGKPSLIDNRAVQGSIHYSVSHSGRFWACLMAFENVGLDIEDMDLWRGKNHDDKPLKRKKTLQYEAIAKRFFTPEEISYVASTGIEGFFDIWVRKEAFIKFKGKGLSLGFKSFSVVGDGRLLDRITTSAQAGANRLEEDIIHMYSSPTILDTDIKMAYCLKNKKKIEELRDVPLTSKKYVDLKDILVEVKE